MNVYVSGYIHATMNLFSVGPTNCTMDFLLLSTSSTTITFQLIAANCSGSVPVYEVVATSMSTGTVTDAVQVNSTVYQVSSLLPGTVYYLQPVDPLCPNVIFERHRVVTNMSASKLCNCIYVNLELRN